jgi:hypothetical protein
MGYAVGKAKNGDYSITLVLDKQRMSAQWAPLQKQYQT